MDKTIIISKVALWICIIVNFVTSILLSKEHKKITGVYDSLRAIDEEQKKAADELQKMAEAIDAKEKSLNEREKALDAREAEIGSCEEFKLNCQYIRDNAENFLREAEQRVAELEDKIAEKEKKLASTKALLKQKEAERDALVDNMDLEHWTPITPEYLQKNGWVFRDFKDKDRDFWLLKKERNPLVWFEWHEVNDTLFVGDGLYPAPVKYVEQLQVILAPLEEYMHDGTNH